MASAVSLDSLSQDLKYGARQLRMSPGFTAVAVLSLALGIGANTAIFQLIDSVRLRTLPVRDPQQIAFIDFPPGSARSGWFSTRSARMTSTLWELIRDQQQAFQTVAAASAARFNLANGGEVRYAEGLYVSGAFFETLGVNATIGRVLAASDDSPGCASPGAVLSNAFWQREYAGDLAVLNRTISLDGRKFPILGVTPPSFFGYEVGNRFDVAIPLCADRLLSEDGRGRAPSKHAWWLSMFGRLKPGWTVERATAQLEAISPGIMQAAIPPIYRPDMAKRFLANKLTALPGATGVSGLRRTYETPLWLLLATTGLVLLIACANLANLLLARASVREREIAVRLALGASRFRLIAQLLAESLLLAGLGAVLGTVLAQALSRGLIAFLTTDQNRLFVGVGLDWRVLGFTAAIAVSTCLLFGLLPAVRATRIAPSSAMRASGRGMTANRERFGARRVLVIAQVALSLVLLVGALLFVRSLRNLMTVETGFLSEGLISVSVDTRKAAYTKERFPIVYRQLLDEIRTRPGVVSAADVNFTPVSGSSWDGQIRPDGVNVESKRTLFNRVGPGYFKTMGTQLIGGREFNDRDTINAPKVLIINEVLAKRIFNGQDPIGRLVRIEAEAGKADPVYEIVGVVKQTKYGGLREEFEPIGFYPEGQNENPGAGHTYVVRIAGSAGDVTRELKSAVAAVNPEIAVEFRIVTEQLTNSLTRERLMATLSGAFGLLAGALATLGLYGVIAYMVAKRRNEIGIRIALGADRRKVVRLVLREAWVLLAIGMALGGGLAVLAGRQAETLLFGLKAWDPATLVSAMLFLAVVAIAASYGPARRAAGMEPMAALREE
ncbi:MAG: ABC transporter permease [Acidobacteria bacterium]|nr:ABC transporter permease [Acidobacteriota bacterium]